MPGILFFQSVESFVASVDYALDSPLPDIRTWSHVAESIHRDSQFSVTARSPSFDASIQFTPHNTNEGGYRITFTAPRHRENEVGTIDKVLELDDDQLDMHSLPALRPFRYRYRVVTLANDRQRTRKVWFIALDQCTEVSISLGSVCES